ncbi:MAG: hypothetical protein WC307_07120 [Candidatus Nanoarchaeia archaeon]|jgi:hypothetical protein
MTGELTELIAVIGATLILFCLPAGILLFFGSTNPLKYLGGLLVSFFIIVFIDSNKKP